MNSLKPFCLLLAATLLVIGTVPAAAQTEAPALIEEEAVDHTRQGFFFSLNLGAGGAEGRFGIPNHPEVDQEREFGVGVDVRLGWAANEWLLAGFNGIAWLKNYDVIDGESGQAIPSDVSYSIAGGFVQVYFFRDFFVRGMAGAGFTHVSPRNEETLDETGLGYAFGLGWEARLTETLALTPTVEYGRVLVDNVDVEDGDGGTVPIDPSGIFVTASLGLTWYF